MRLVYFVLPALLTACASVPQGGAEATLALLETTDLHANVLSYDYYKLQADPAIGLERTATLIKQARAEYPNNLLLDNGDALQGTALADYQALVKPVACGEAPAIYKAMNQLGVDGAGIGSCITANKVPGVRAAMCYDEATARNSREHNYANVLTLGGKMISPERMREVVRAWLATDEGAERHRKRVAKITTIERQYLR